MYLIFLFNILFFTIIDSSRILVCVPFPSVSHQYMFYPLIKGLLNRGHEVVFLTTDAMYPKGQAPANLTEIDTHDASYEAWRQQVVESSIMEANKGDLYKQASRMIPIVTKSFEIQIITQEFQDLTKNKTHFDLLILEGFAKSAQALSYVFNAPFIIMNSLGAIKDNLHVVGAPIFPKLLYPRFWHQKLVNLSILDKIKVLYDTYQLEKLYDDFRPYENYLVKKLFGPDVPSLEEVGNKCAMVFLNIYPIWEYNRPVPPGVVFIGGLHKSPVKDLPENLNQYLDSSKEGVVYFSLGTNVSPSTLSAEKIKAITNGLAKLKYDILVKWDSEELPGKGNNTRVAKWFPQADILRHPKVKAFVTQGGLQSFDEAMNTGVPLVGIPMLGDQWYNVERYASLNIGVALLMEELTEDILATAINTVIDDPSYHQNFLDLRERVRDQPESALQRAIWWTEHVIRHRGAKHLRASAANMDWPEFLDLQLWVPVALFSLSILAVLILILYLIIKRILKTFNQSAKQKTE